MWSVPPDQFVAARNAAIAERKAAGDVKGAAALKAMKRPSPSAWLVNALVRGASKEVEALFRAGDTLIAAQGRVLGGADPDVMHAAMRGVREATGRALKQARAILAEHGRKPTADLTRRVTHTLRSASLDRRLRDVVLEGTLTSDPSADDLEALAEVKIPKRVARPKKPARKGEDVAKQKREAARAEREAKQARAREEREAKKRAAHEAREKLRAEVTEAAEAAEEARRALARAQAEERRAKAAAAEAAHEVQRAKKALTTAEQRHARAKKRYR